MDLIIPICPTCKIEMQLRYTMKGDQFLCPNYHKCGERESLEKMYILQ